MVPGPLFIPTDSCFGGAWQDGDAGAEMHGGKVLVYFPCRVAWFGG